jgi:N-carbamoyl-L-amino-acid hydrolase
MPLTRRRFLQAAAAAPLYIDALWPSAAAARQSSRANPAINAARLRTRIERLAEFGRPTAGGFADGVTRLGYSEADVAGRAYVTTLMRAAGLTPRVDEAGNIFARREGRDPRAAPILFGSHIDSVPSGGNFDGDLGVLASIEVVQTLVDRGETTRRPLEVVIWANEEGAHYTPSLSGSRAVAGRLLDGEMEQTIDGVTKAQAIARIGGSPQAIRSAHRPGGWFHGYLELHIEQGGTLEQTSTSIGVVEGIVSIQRYQATIRGFANHAGTTPMSERQDALIAASQLTLAVREIVTKEPGRQVGTVGQLAVSPNAPNVIPGMVRMIIELRDLASDRLDRLAAAIQARAQEIAQATKTTVEMVRTANHEGAPATPAMQDLIEEAASDLGLSRRRLPSGAGHDAQMMAVLGPMGMIFVPSVGGVSHSPRELTSWEDCARGADVLFRSVLALDRTPESAL